MAGPVATVWAQMRLNISDFASGLRSASKQLSSFAAQQQRVLKNQNQGYTGATAMIKSFNRSLSDTVNITRGIVISQAFYAGVGAIREATNALWEFNKELDYAKVTYSALFGDAALANDFMSVLQEHAVETIFDYQGLAGISKKLLAYGLEYENLMFVMEGLTNLGTMSGDSAALDRIALALGQIYTKGKLSAEEMRQLANAYVPISEIIQEKFGLSEEDLGRVGDLNLPAEEVINAIVDYANENFASVGDAAMYTITGLQAKIVDTLKVVGSEMLQPVTTAYKSFLAYISNGLEVLRAEFSKGGIGGVFEYLVPDEGTQKTIRIFVANIKNLFMSVVSLGKAAASVFGNFAQTFVAAFNLVSPVVTGFINTLAYVIDAMSSTSGGAALLRVALVGVAGAFIMMRVQALGALVITAVTTAVQNLSKALSVLATIISKHPILSLLAMLGVALLGITVSSNSANNALSGFFDTIAGAGGSSSSDTLQSTKEEVDKFNDALDKFNNRLEEGQESAEDFEDGINDAGAAAKKARGLLSFDEVFRLNEPASSDSGIGTGITDDITDIIDGLGSLGSALVPEIPDFSDYFSDFSESLFGGLGDGLKDKFAAGGWGAIIGGILGALIGSIFGQPVLGAKIGAGVGAIVGVIFDEIEYYISNTGVGLLSGIGAALSKGMAASLTDIFKGLLTADSIDDFFRMFVDMFKQVGAKNILKGGLIGAAIGLLTDGIAHLLWSFLDEKIAAADADAAKIGQTIGSLFGTIIGTIIGGPFGALVGSIAGTFVGGLYGLFWYPIRDFYTGLAVAVYEWASGIFKDVSVWWNETSGIGPWLAETWEGFRTWFDNTVNLFAAWTAVTAGRLVDWFVTTISKLTTWWTDTKEGFSAWWSNTIGGLGEWFTETIRIFSDWDSINSDTLANWWKNTKDGFTGWLRDTVGSLVNWWEETTGGFTTWWKDTIEGFASWASATVIIFGNWWSNTKERFVAWSADVALAIAEWAHGVIVAVHKWAYDVLVAFHKWHLDTIESVINWVVGMHQKFTEFKESVLRVIGGFCIAALLAIDQWLSDTWTSIATWFSNTKTDIKNWWHGLFDINTWKTAWVLVSGWFTGLKNKYAEWFTTTKEDVKSRWKSLFDINGWTSGWSLIKTWFNNLLNDIAGWFSSLRTSVSTWWDNLWSDKDITVGATANFGGSSTTSLGHATGGVFNREHIARFAEGNKAEAIIPLENSRAMQPFVDAVSNGIVSSLAPIVAMAGNGSNNNLPPMYVGTLIADDAGLRQLYKKFEVIQVQENDRRGTNREVF